MLKLAQTNQPTDQPTNRPTDRAKTIYIHKTNVLTIFELDCCIKETFVLTKFHKDWAKNHKCFLDNIHIEKTAPPPGGHVTSREKAPPPHGGHVFLPIQTIFELNRRIQETNVLTKFHEDWNKNVTSRVENCPAPPPGSHVFSPIWTIFEDINETHVFTKFHDDWAKVVTPRVFTRNTAPPPGGHLHEDWASNVTSTVFELSRVIIGTNVLTKFHEDRTRNVASRVFTRQNFDNERRTHDGRRTKGDPKSSP
ncbi:hypothetical protein DPMN_033039 [Dreissena polymorpha]|uniref:Uncharacterized protein n=1 Tax=Dreissena polymorpha TaxID=45954 RepID=A0A9D4M584_DREPO|nr:hypothetical protein DPMN_033039 [Dreissena polymorpha]